MLAGSRAAAQADPALASAARFVAGFYGWYVPAAKQGSGWTLVIRDSAHLFATELVEALRADADAQARTPDAIVGLDGDPFLNAQDFCDAYVVGQARRADDSVVVEVDGDCRGAPDTTPDVMAVVQRSHAGWVFVNFRYPPDNSDLLQVLRRLRRLREIRE
jgi:hypothetical protein